MVLGVQLQKDNVLSYIKNVAIYLRKSRGDLEEDLIKHRSHIIEICEQNEWNYLEYKEIGSGDSIEGRVAIKDLLRDIESNMFDAVIVFDYDRLGRGNATDQDTISRTLRRANTLIITAYPFTVLDPNDERDEETMEFKGFLARREYKMITKRLSGGKKFGARLGRWSNGVPPYGYSYDPARKSLVINQEQAKAYTELIKKPFLEGESLHNIAWNLNRKGIPSPRNGKWHPETIKNILINEVHLGWVVSNKTEGVRDSQNVTGDKKPFKQKPKEEWVIVKNCHPKLKTEEEHELIKKELKKRTRHRNGNNVNPLSGLVKCYNCGSTMTMQKTEDDRVMIKKCLDCGKSKGGDSELVQKAIFYQLKKVRKALKDKQSKLNTNKRNEGILMKIDELESELDLNEQAIQKIEDAYEMGMYTPEKAQKKMKVRNERISELEEEIRDLKNKLSSLSGASNNERVKIIDRFYDDYDENHSGEKQNSLYKTIIDHVVWQRISNDEIRVIVNFL